MSNKKTKPMKKVKLLLVLLLALTTATLYGNKNENNALIFQFSNVEYFEEEGINYLQFDVEAKLNEAWAATDPAPIYLLNGGQIAFTYNTEVFGTNIRDNNKVTVEKLDLFAGEAFPGFPKYPFLGVGEPGTDNQPNRFYVGALAAFNTTSGAGSPVTHNEFTTEFQGIFRIKIEITNPGSPDIVLAGSQIIDGGWAYQDPAGGIPIVFPFPYIYPDPIELDEPLCLVEIMDPCTEPIVVDYGTLLADALLELPATTMIVDSEGDNYTVDLAWDIPGYNGEIAGDYTAVGTFDLPMGVENCEDLLLEVSCIVTVLEPEPICLVDIMDPCPEPIVVEFGTLLADVLAELPATTTITDSEDANYIVDLTWDIPEYNGEVAGDYSAVGTFELPLNIENCDDIPLEVICTVTVLEAELVFLELPYCNEFRTDDDFDQAVEDGFGLEDVEQRTAAGGYLLFVSQGAFLETPTIDFTDYEEIIVSFATATFGVSGGQTLALEISADNGATWETLYTTTPTSSSPYIESEVIIDLTDVYNVAEGKLRFFFIEGPNGIRFRDMCIEPYVEPVFFTLTVDVVGDGDVFVNDVLYTEPVIALEGTELNLVAVPSPDWSFVGWTGDLVSEDAAQTLLMDGDKAVTATFEEIPPEQYTLTLNIIGEGDVFVNDELYTEPVTVMSGTELNLVAVPSPDWSFVGWTGDLVSENAAETLLMDGDKAVTATFEEIPPEEYTLTINVAGEGDVFVDGVLYTEPITVIEGTELALLADPADGWAFIGWTGDLVSDEAAVNLLMDDDKNITATFEFVPTEFTLTINIEGQGTVEVDGVEYTEPLIIDAGAFVQLAALPDMDWEFAGWFGDLVSTDPLETVQMDSDKTITARFTGLQVEVTITDVSCFGGDDGEIFVSITGGQKPYNISLYAGCDRLAPPMMKSDVKIQTVHYTGLLSMNYYLSIVDANGVTWTGCLPVGEPDPLTVEIQTEPVLCFGDPGTGLAKVTVSGGTPPYTIEFLGETYILNDNEAPYNIWFEDLEAGVYEVIVNDANDCGPDVYEFEIFDPEPIVADVVYDPIECFGETTLVDVIASGGTGTLALYDVVNGELVFVSDLPLAEPLELPAGEYLWAVVDENDCVEFLEFEIEQPEEIIPWVEYDHILCFGETTEVFVNAMGGTGALTLYDVFDGDLVEVGLLPLTLELGAGEYTWAVMDENGCVVPLDFEIVQPDELIVDIVTFPVSELGGQDGEIHVTMSGGVGPYNIFLYTTCDIDGKDAESFDKSQGAVYTGLPAGEYMIVVIDQNGCTYMECVEVETDMDKDPLSDDYLNLKEPSIVAYPNPFRDETVIEFVLVESSYVTLEVYNMIGEKVTVLFQGQVDAFEPYTVNMRAGDLPNGVYFYRLNTGKGTFMNKLILAR